MHLGTRNHIYQDQISGSFIIENIQIFDFIDAVETHRNSSQCPFSDILILYIEKVGPQVKNVTEQITYFAEEGRNNLSDCLRLSFSTALQYDFRKL